jgi:DNA-binding XRE family transcriptional regulator
MPGSRSKFVNWKGSQLPLSITKKILSNLSVDTADVAGVYFSMATLGPDFSAMVLGVRSKLGMDQSQFAQLIGVTPAAVYMWEKGTRQPEGAALRVIYALHQRIQQRKLGERQLQDIFKTLAVGAAAVGFIALLEALFSSDKKPRRS